MKIKPYLFSNFQIQQNLDCFSRWYSPPTMSAQSFKPKPLSWGDGVLLIDQIDTQLDSTHCSEILNRLHQAFPRLQIIATGSREELLEHASTYQCLKLEHGKISHLDLNTTKQQLEHIYTLLQRSEPLTPSIEAQPLSLIDPTPAQIEVLFQQIQGLNEQQKMNY